MVDPIYRLWFPQLFIEEEDESLVRAVEEIEAEEKHVCDYRCTIVSHHTDEERELGDD